MQSDNLSNLGKKLVLIFAVSAFVFIGAVVLFSSMMSASAEPEGSPTGWTAILTDDFEGPLNKWTIAQTAGSGDYYWAATTYTQTEGAQSVWATGGGTDGSGLTAGTDDYPANVVSSMQLASSVDLTGTNQVRLTFDYWTDLGSGDLLNVGVSTNGTDFTGVDSISGNSNGWQSKTIDLNDYAGETTVWIDFVFSSNADASVGKGAFVDNVVLEGFNEQLTYLPILIKDPTPTPTATPAYLYQDNFSDPGSGWPIVDNRHDPSDCFRWWYSSGSYNVEICDDRTDVKASPLVRLPNGDYEIEVDARFSTPARWWDSYGILFDAKDDPNPNNPDLGDYYMLWVLWEGEGRVLYKILNDVPGDQEDLFPWVALEGNRYNYDSNGTSWNRWKITRRSDKITISLNGTVIKTVNEPRPTSNYQYLFGVYAATYETHPMSAAFDNYTVRELGTGRGEVLSTYNYNLDAHPYVVSGEFDLDEFLPNYDE